LESKPKVLFIAVDDMNNGITLFGKVRPFRGPNLEKLGNRGEFFSKVLLLLQCCNPSWISILTGKRPYIPDFFNSNETIKGYNRHPRAVHLLVPGKIDADSFTINPIFRLLPWK